MPAPFLAIKFLGHYVFIVDNNIYMEKLMDTQKDIGLGAIFENNLWKNDKTINFFDGFLYFL